MAIAPQVSAVTGPLRQASITNHTVTTRTTATCTPSTRGCGSTIA